MKKLTSYMYLFLIFANHFFKAKHKRKQK